jgi:hypothetical protein
MRVRRTDQVATNNENCLTPIGEADYIEKLRIRLDESESALSFGCHPRPGLHLVSKVGLKPIL